MGGVTKQRLGRQMFVQLCKSQHSNSVTQPLVMYLVRFLCGVVTRGEQHVCQGGAGGRVRGGGGAWASSLQQGLMGTSTVDLGTSFLGGLPGPPRLAAAVLQASPSLHHGWGATDLLQDATQSCRGSGSGRVVRVHRGPRGGREVPYLWPCVDGLRGRGGGRGDVIRGDGGAPALGLEELLQPMAQSAHVLPGIVGDFGQTVLRLRCPSATLRLRTASGVRLLRALLTTTLLHHGPPVSQCGCTWGCRGLAMSRCHTPSERLVQSREAEGMAHASVVWRNVMLV